MFDMRARVLLVLVIVACTPKANEASSVAPLPEHGAASDASTPVTEARWVPRVAPFVTQPARMRQRFYGPVQNNEGTHATVYLARSTVALVDRGKRWLWKDSTLTPVAADDGAAGLETIDAVAPALGGGFVFTGSGGVFYASTLEAPLVVLARDRAALVGIGPRSVLLSSGLVGFDGKLITSAPPNASEVATNPVGFGLAQSSDGLYFSSDGRAWKSLGRIFATTLARDGDAMLALEGEKAVRIARDGTVKPVQLTGDERFALRMNAMRPDEIPDDGFEGSRREHQWSAVGKDAWIRVKGRDIEILRPGAGAGVRIGTAPGDGCAAFALERPLVACFELGARLRVFALDLTNGALVLEKDVKVKAGIARYMGFTQGSWPPTLYALMTCDGDASGGLCVRDEHGGWATFPAPRDSKVLVFPGEVFTIASGPHDEWELRSHGALVGSFKPPARFVPPPNAKLEDLKVVDLGVARTAGAVVLFEGPNPWVPAISPESYMVRFPVGTSPTPTVTSVPGFVAVAGMDALRLDQGKLYETRDGWETWREVAPPPTGPLADLAGAMCSEMGCSVGPWMRMGWTLHP